MPTQTVSVTATSADLQMQQTTAVTDVQSKSVDKTLAPSTTNYEVDCVLTRAQIKAISMQSIGGDLTIKTNSTSAPGDTVTMTAGQVWLWSSTAGVGTDPFPTADVTKLYLTTTAGTTFNLRAIVTATNG